MLLWRSRGSTAAANAALGAGSVLRVQNELGAVPAPRAGATTLQWSSRAILNAPRAAQVTVQSQQRYHFSRNNHISQQVCRAGESAC